LITHELKNYFLYTAAKVLLFFRTANYLFIKLRPEEE
jgi:hypothetical protein